MSLIVDTYNVTHVVGILPPDLAGIDTLGLIRLLANSRFQREQITSFVMVSLMKTPPPVASVR